MTDQAKRDRTTLYLSGPTRESVTRESVRYTSDFTITDWSGAGYSTKSPLERTVGSPSHALTDPSRHDPPQTGRATPVNPRSPRTEECS